MYTLNKANSTSSKKRQPSLPGLFSPSITGGALIFLMLFLPLAKANDSELALSYAFGDSGLKWEPCPDFLPVGCQIAVLHGDMSEPNADIFLRVPGNSNLPSHWHNSAERMVLVAGKLNLTYKGQKTFVLKPGMYVYGPSKVLHNGRCVSSQPCVIFIAFETEVDATAVGVTRPPRFRNTITQ